MPICEGCKTIMSHEESQEAHEQGWQGYCPECIAYKKKQRGTWRHEEQHAKSKRDHHYG